METEKSNYIYLPLICLFISIIGFLMLSESYDRSGMIPYGVIFILSVVDIYKALMNDVPYDKITNNTTYYGAYNRSYNNVKVKTYSSNNDIVKAEASKVRNMLKKSKAIKVLKEKK